MRPAALSRLLFWPLLLAACTAPTVSPTSTLAPPTGAATRAASATPAPPTPTVARTTPTPLSISLTPAATVRLLPAVDLFCPSANVDARQAFDEASGLQEAGQLAEAEVLYLRAIELDPDFCDAMDNLGQMLRQQGRVDEAIAWYTKSLAVLPENTVALQNLGLAYKVQGQLAEAQAIYERLIAVDPQNPEGYFGLGTVYFEQQELELAIENLKQAQGLYGEVNAPYAADAAYYLGFTYFIKQDCVETRKYLAPIYDHFAEDDYLNYALGVCYVISEPADIPLARTYLLKAQALGVTIPDDLLAVINAAP